MNMVIDHEYGYFLLKKKINRVVLVLRLYPDPPKLDGRLSLVAWGTRWVVLEEFVESLPDDDVPKFRSADEVRNHVSLVSL